MNAIELVHCREQQGFAHGLFQPFLVGELLVHHGVSLPLGRLLSVMQQVFDRLPVAVAAPERPTDAPSLCAWVLAHSHRLQLAHRQVVLAPPRVLGHRAVGGVTQAAFALPYHQPALALAGLRWVVGVVNLMTSAAAKGAAGHEVDTLQNELTNDIKQAMARLGGLGRQMRAVQAGGVNTERMLVAAMAHQIPITPLGRNTYQLGHGVHGRWLQSSFTDETSHLGALFARDKVMASHLLERHGLPVAPHRLVADGDDAVRAADALGYPVVVKAANLDGGVGVHAGLTTEAQVRRCYDEARRHTRSVMVERHQHGADYRLTVVHGQLVKAIQRLPGGVTGDGQRTVAELIKAASQDPQNQRRMRERGKTLLSLDDEALELLQARQQGPETVLPAGEFVALRRRANVSTGGNSVTLDLSDVHPDNALLAVRAASALRLDVAGVDLIVPSIQQSWQQTGGIVCEVNGQPQFGENQSPGLYLRFFRSLMGGNGRIPLVVVACAALPTEATVQAWTDQFAQGHPGVARVHDGLLTLDGVVVNPQKKSNHRQMQAALLHRQVARVLCVMSHEELFRDGLPAPMVGTLVMLLSPGADAGAQKKTEARVAALKPHVLGELLFAQSGVDAAWQQVLAHPTA